MHCFFLMAAVAASLFTFMRRRRYGTFGMGHWGRHGGGSWGGGPFGAYRSWHRGHPERIADWLALRLDASPEQRRVIRDELEQFSSVVTELRREMRLSGGDIATALRAEHFDAELMGHTFSRQDDGIRSVREALVGALAKIHDALDERQRRRLASFLDAGV